MNAVLLGFLVLATQSNSSSPRFLSGSPPDLPPLAAEGGFVGLELRVTASGMVREAVVIDDSPPFTAEIQRVGRLWTFDEARIDGKPVEARIAVVGVFRAPTLFGGAPAPPKRAAGPSAEIPYPTSTATPAYPPQALESGVVMLEVEVDEDGAVAAVEILEEAEGFSAVAVEAAQKFRFQPARRDGRAVRAFAILIFGFPQPVTRPLRR
jgi:TonB family protein